LSSEQVEELCRCCAVNNLHVNSLHSFRSEVIISWDSIVLITKLKISFNSGRWVLWAIAIITVREKHDKTGSCIPLCLSWCDKCINNNLSLVWEITELCFPDN
jgi:hypothetical protein